MGIETTRPLWDTLRAGLIALVLLVHGSKILPWPDVGRSDLAYGVAQDNLAQGAALLTRLGRPTTVEELAQDVLAVGRASGAAQRWLYGPFQPLLKRTGTGQSWGLFAYPDPYAGRLVVSSRVEGGGWEERYRAPGRGDPWLVSLLEYRRIRGLYDDNGDRPKPGGFYNPFCDWVAVELLAREPELEAVEIRLDLVTNLRPGSDKAPVPDKRRHVRTRARADVAALLALREAP